MDATSATGAGRLCGYSGCRAALPETTGPGNRAKYCQDDTKRWGSKGLSCKAAALAVENVASLGGPAALTDPSVVALGEQLDRALPPLVQLATLITTVRAELDEALVSAHRERDAALARAADAEGRAGLAADDARAARRLAEQADEAAAAAHQLRVQADVDRDQAQQAQRRAELAQAGAEARLTEAHDVASRADRRATAAATHTQQLDHQLAGLRAELLAAQEALEEERQRLNAETERANHAITTAAQQREQLRHDYDQRLEQARADHEQALGHARADYDQRIEDARAAHVEELTSARRAADTAVQQTRDQAEQARQADGQRHSREIGELHERIGGRTQQLRELHRALTEALAGADDLQALREQLARLTTQQSED
jgi:chromosome segregation ATPase